MKVKHTLFYSFLLLVFNVFSQENIYSSLTIPEELVKNANAVVRLNMQNVLIESQRKMMLKSKRIITVLNEEGNSFVGAISGYDKYNKIKKIEAIIYDAHGEEIKKIKKKDFVDYSAVDGGTLYSDSRMLFMSYVPTKYPYTVEFVCEMETPNTAGIPSWQPIEGYFLSIEKNSYSVSDFTDLGLRVKEINLKEFDVKKTGSANQLDYVISNMSAVKPEAMSPGLSKFAPRVLLAVDKFHFYGVDGQASNWLEFGNWIHDKLLNGRGELTDITKDKILDLTNNIENPIEKAKIVYQYVQDNTRYISVQVGIGGVQPISAMEVDKLKYGDCKGLTNYTQALLKVVGVESYYTVVEAGRYISDFYEDFASLEQGNHIILCIPTGDKYVWLDCTSQKHPFGFIGDFTDDRNVLVVKSGGSEIVKTCKYSNKTNHKTTKSEISLFTNGSIQANIGIKTQGIKYDNRFFIKDQSDRDINEFYKETWGYVNNLEINDYKFRNDKKSVEFFEDLKVEATNYATKIGDRLMFKPNCFDRNSFVPDRYRNRKLSMEIQRGYLDEDIFEISIPKGYLVEASPNKKEIVNKFGEYVIDFSIENNKITYQRKLLIRKGNYSKEDYNLYREFRRNVSKLDNSKIVLIKSE